jgi:hypothetical protein
VLTCTPMSDPRLSCWPVIVPRSGGWRGSDRKRLASARWTRSGIGTLVEVG